MPTEFDAGICVSYTERREENLIVCSAVPGDETCYKLVLWGSILSLNYSLVESGETLIQGTIEYPNMTESHNGGVAIEHDGMPMVVAGKKTLGPGINIPLTFSEIYSFTRLTSKTSLWKVFKYYKKEETVSYHHRLDRITFGNIVVNFLVYIIVKDYQV